MVLFTLDSEGKRCGQVPVNFSNARFSQNHYLRQITATLNNYSLFEAYRNIPESYGFSAEKCEIDSVSVCFQFFEESRSIKISANVWVKHPDFIGRHYCHKLHGSASKLEIARILAEYFATSVDEHGHPHSVTCLQSIFWRFIQWIRMIFATDLTEIPDADREGYSAALQNAFDAIAHDPYLPHDHMTEGRAVRYWLERENGVCREHHYLVADKSGKVYHYCPENNILFEEV